MSNQTPLNPDALRVATTAAHDAVDWQMYDVTKFDLEDSVDVATLAAVSAYLAVAQPVAQKLTDAEWQEFQAIPDQGYSHRSWVDARIAERVAAAHQTVNSLTGLPNNTVIEDSSGDIGIIFNNEIWYPECNPMSIDRAAQRYAPFIIRHSPEANTNE